MSEESPEAKVHLLTKVRAVVCPMLVNLIVGSYYCYSNINPYVAAYLSAKAEERGDAEVTEADTLLIMPVWLFFQSVFAILSVRLADYLGYWMLNLVAFFCAALTHLAASYVTSFTAFILVYGVGTGVFIGTGYLPALYISWTYFPQRKSVVTGAILFCSGISGVILSPLTTMIANPDNVAVQDIRSNSDVYNRVPSLFRFMAGYFGALALVATLLQPRPLQSRRLQAKTALRRELKAEMRRSGTVNEERREDLRTRIHELDLAAELHLPAELRCLERNELLNEVKTGLAEQAGLMLGQLGEDRVEDLVRHNVVIREIASIAKSRDPTSVKQLSLLAETGGAGETRLLRLPGAGTSGTELVVEVDTNECPTFMAGVRSGVFLHLCAMAFCVSMYNYFLNASWKKFYPTQFEVEDSKFALLLSIGALSNSLFRLGIGLLLVKLSFKTLYLANVAIAAVSAFSVCRVATGYDLGAVYLALAFGGLGAQVTLFPTICVKVFGATVGPRIYPCVFFLFSAASLSQYTVLKLAGDRYELMCRIFGAVSVLGFALGACFNPDRDWSKEIKAHRARQASEEARLAQGSEPR